MVKTFCSHKQPTKKDLWGEDEDEKMIKHGRGLRRSGKSGKQKWYSEKKPDKKHKSFTPQEEELVIKLHAAIGSRWPIIAQQLPGKTENDVKILWNNKLRKKLSAMGIDPVTHRPFSQILADYGNIGAFPKARTGFSSLSRDLKNSILSNPEQSQIRNPQAFSNPHLNNFSIGNCKIEPSSDQHCLDLYSQLQAINLVTDASNYNTAEKMAPNFTTEFAELSSECTSLSMVNHEISSFAWSDFLLEDALYSPIVEEHDNMGSFFQYHEENNAGKQRLDENEKSEGLVFEASTSSKGSFVEAMIERQVEMYYEFPAFYEEPFYY